MKSFYENVSILDGLKRLSSPVAIDKLKLYSLINDDEALMCYFYEQNDYGGSPDSAWVKFLAEAGEFDGLVGSREQASQSQWLKAKYLERIAGEVPEAVLSIIAKIKPENEAIQGMFIEAIACMPDDWIEKGCSVVKGFIEKREHLIWYWAGESSAKVMEKVLLVNPDMAYEIARLLLDLWAVKDDEKGHLFEDVRGKFSTDEYADFVFKHYIKLWERDAYRAAMLLVEIFDGYLNDLNASKEFDVSKHFYITMENLDQLVRLERDYEGIITEGICQTGKKMIADQQANVGPLLGHLRSLDKAIFTRIEMYLLRFVQGDKYRVRINEIIGDKDNFDSPGFKYEYNQLLKEQIGVVTEETKHKYIGWVENIEVDDLKYFADWFKRTRGRNYEKSDLEKYESGMRARKLFLVKDLDAFSELYEKYRDASEATDDDLKPEPVISGVRRIAGDEGTSLTREEMLQMGVKKVLGYLQEPEHYKDVPSAPRPNRPMDALAYAFQQTVKDKPVDYISAAGAGLANIPVVFLKKVFYGVWEALREGAIDGFDWDAFIDFCASITGSENAGDMAEALEPMVSCLQECFAEPNKLKFTYGRIRKLYYVLWPLFGLDERRDAESERDPVQIRCNTFTGNATRIYVNLGIVCKTEFPQEYEDEFRVEFERVFEKVLEEVKTSWTLCTFGSDFARIHWLAPEWVEKNLGGILSDQWWDVVWGTYLHWGRPTEDMFHLLAAKGIYAKAIGLMGRSREEADNSGKVDDKELYKHLLIAYFNGWIDYEDEVLGAFFKKASGKLRGRAARFLRTGFQEVSEETDAARKEAGIERVRQYWRARLKAASTGGDDAREEMMGFAVWVENFVLTGGETLEMLHETLRVTRGGISQDSDVRRVFKQLCEIGRGRELVAIKCMNLMCQHRNVGQYFYSYKDKLGKFMDSILEIGNDHPEAGKIREQAMELADAFGRMRVYDFRRHWEALRAGFRPA